MTAGEYKAIAGGPLSGTTPGGSIAIYPDSYVIGSHATLILPDGTTMTGEY